MTRHRSAVPGEEVRLVIRKVRLREDLLPVPFFDARGSPLSVHWVGIVYTRLRPEDRLDEVEGYDLSLFDEEGHIVEWLQYETLEIALDQAAEILGIQRAEWEECRLELPYHGRDYLPLKWEDLA